MLRNYYQLTKPGVLYGNALTTVAGFLFASRGIIDIGLLLMATIGSTLIIASACVINNYLDQDIDRLMSRTKKRPLITGAVNPRNALAFGIILGLLGVGLLAAFTSWLVVAIGIFGFIVYVFLYGALSKRRSVHGTLVGSVSGAIPILAGYVAASGGFDLGAILVFVVLFLWQMPEFYSISVYRRNEYKAAGVPVISVVQGIEHTKRMIFIYTILFVAATLGLFVVGYAGYVYFAAMLLLGIRWIFLGSQAFHADDDAAWARRMFRFSLVILLVFSFLISIEAYVP